MHNGVVHPHHQQQKGKEKEVMDTRKVASAKGTGGDDTDVVLASGTTLPADLYQNPHEYAPVTRDVMRVLHLLGQRDGKWLIRAVFQALFGTPRTCHDLIMLWFRTVARARPVQADRTGKDADHHQYGPAELLEFLTNASAAPCVRHHRVGGYQRHAVYLLPFGTGSELATMLAVPLAHADPRLVRSVQLLAHNPWAFRHMEEDPVFGFFTLSCFAYSDAAQDKLDHCRPMLLAAAVRALAMQTRLEVARSERGALLRRRQQHQNPPRSNLKVQQTRELIDRRVLSQHPTYVRAMVEKRVLDGVRNKIAAAARPDHVSATHSSLGHRLLMDALAFVLDERTFPSLAQQSPISHDTTDPSKLQLPTVPYAILPSDAELQSFVEQTHQAWLQALGKAGAKDEEAESGS